MDAASVSGGQSEQQVLKKEEDALSKPSLVFTAHNQSSGGCEPEREATCKASTILVWLPDTTSLRGWNQWRRPQCMPL